jgi:hypothetical protein
VSNAVDNFETSISGLAHVYGYYVSLSDKHEFPIAFISRCDCNCPFVCIVEEER